MENRNSWPPTPKNQVPFDPRPPRSYLFVKVPVSAVGIGLALGILDVFRADDWAEWLTIGAAFVLGFLHPKTLLLSVFILSLCLYLVHVAAIQHGVKQPYVERDVESALACWQSLLLNSLGGFVGAAVKVFERYAQAGPQRP